MEIIETGTIVKELDDSLALSITFTNSSSSSSPSVNLVIKKNLVFFRGKIAPKNLLKANTFLKVKVVNKIIQSAEIDSNLEINAIFGYIGEMNDSLKTLIIKTYNHDQEIGYQELLGPDNKVLKQGTHQSYIYQPVIMYFNKDAIIEARILNEPIDNSYKLAEFHTNQFDQKEYEFIVLKDDRLIPHKIHKSRVFYKNSYEVISKHEVEGSIGTEVKVRIEQKQIKAFVQKELPKNPNPQGTTSLPATRKLLYQNLRPDHGKRQKLIPGYFIKEIDEYDRSLIMLLSLLEVCYRLPDWQMRQLLLKEISQSVKISKNESDKLELLLNTVVNTELGNIERFYKLFKESISVMQYVSKLLFKNPFNFNQICNKYRIYIFETNRSMQQWKTYKPYYVIEPIPIIYLCNESKLGIIYDSNMMLYDGYSPSGDEYIVQKYFNTDSLKFKSENGPNYLDLFKAAKKLQEKLSRTDEESFKIYFELVNSLNTLIPPEIAPQYENLYQDLLNFNFDPNFIELKCNCGAKANKDYQCSGHYLCEGCAFISLRLRQCLTCSAQFRTEVNVKENNCSACKSSYESKYFFGYRCRCVLCCNCLNHLLSQKCKVCYNSHELDDYSIGLAIEFLRALGYNPLT